MNKRYIDVRIHLDDDDNVVKVERIKTKTTQSAGSSFTSVIAYPIRKNSMIESSEYFTRSDEPEPAWMVKDEGPGHPRIMVLQGTWEEDTPEDQ